MEKIEYCLEKAKDIAMDVIEKILLIIICILTFIGAIAGILALLLGGFLIVGGFMYQEYSKLILWGGIMVFIAIVALLQAVYHLMMARDVYETISCK